MKKVKWGVLGAGGIADRRTLPGMMDCRYAELWAVMEIDPENAERLREKYGAKYAYTSAEELIADPQIEAIYIASPVNFHKSQIMAAVKAGKHILCEKPISITLEDCEEIEAFCKGNEPLTACGFMMRFAAYHQEIKRMIKEGAIGRLITARAQFACWSAPREGAWRHKKALSGGGALMDLGVHAIDVLEYITGQRVASVGAICDTKHFSYDVDDTAALLMKMDGGATAYMDANFNLPSNSTPSRLEFCGTKGSITAIGTLGQVEEGEVQLLLCEEEGSSEVKKEALIIPLGNMYTKEIDSFSRSILFGEPVEVPLTDAVHIQRVCSAAYLSSEEGKFIDIDEK